MLLIQIRWTQGYWHSLISYVRLVAPTDHVAAATAAATAVKLQLDEVNGARIMAKERKLCPPDYCPLRALFSSGNSSSGGGGGDDV